MKKYFLTILIIILGITSFICIKNFFYNGEDTNYRYLVFDENDKAYLKKVKDNFEVEVITDDNFSYKIVDSNNNEVATSLIEKKEYSIIKPKGKYKSGETYTLTIENGTFKRAELATNKILIFKVEREEVEKVTYNDNVKLTDDNSIKIVGSTLKTDREYKVNDIIIINNNASYKITKINSDNTYEIEVPQIEELFENIDIYKEQKVDLRNFEFSEDLENYIIASAKKTDLYSMLVEKVDADSKIKVKIDTENAINGILKLSIEFTIPKGDKNHPIAELKNHDITFGFEFAINVTSQIDWNMSGLDLAINVKLEDGVHFNIDYLDAKLDGLDEKDKAELEKLLTIFSTDDLDLDENELSKVLGKVVVPIGSTGLYFDLNIGVLLDYSIAVDAGYNVKNETNLTFGFSYKYFGGFAPYGYSNRKNVENHAYLGGKASLKLGLESKMGLYFLNIVSVNVDAAAGGYGEAEFEVKAAASSEQSSSFNAKGEIGLFANADLELKALKYEKSIPLLDYKYPIYSFDLSDKNSEIDDNSNMEIPAFGENDKVSINNSDIIKYYNIYSDDDGEYYTKFISEKSTDEKSLSDLVKLEIAARKLTYADVSYYDYSGNPVSKDDYYYKIVVKKEIMDKYVKECFGENATYNTDSLPENFRWFIKEENHPIDLSSSVSYNDQTQSFEILLGGVGGCVGPVPCVFRISKLYEAYQKEDYLYLIVKQLLIVENYVANPANYDVYLEHTDIYKDIDKTQLITNNAIKENGSYASYLDRGGTVTIVLKKDKNGNYYFVKSIIEN